MEVVMKNFIDDYINFILNNKILLILYISTLIIWIIKKIYKFILFYSKNEKKKKINVDFIYFKYYYHSKI